MRQGRVQLRLLPLEPVVPRFRGRASEVFPSRDNTLQVARSHPQPEPNGRSCLPRARRTEVRAPQTSE
jgi:hypothetical protein